MTREQARARAEDLEFMVQTGENVTFAARRLGISAEGLERWCQRNHCVQLFRQLAARELCLFNNQHTELSHIVNPTRSRRAA